MATKADRPHVRFEQGTMEEMGLSGGSPNHSILPIDALWYLNETIEYQANMVKRNTITLTDDGAILLRKAWFEPRVLSSEVKPCAKEHASLWIQRAGQSAKDEGIKYVGGIGLGDSYPLFHHGAGGD
ncbi:conserved hypothetical protein [Histoplasma capsulatum var. duboisii H88]|uniref:Uncharacterized protein n=1 Tax=Ajellomyces capsulatus (strain H88) TaxID=544711 RepID=F0U5D9_AJEC8|nr:conserved hypothetical protein [Histoplasma capsulatum var. duboisii H88]